MDSIQTNVSALHTASEAANAHVVEKTNTFIDWFKTYLTWGYLFKIIGIAFVILLIWIFYKIMQNAIKRLPKEKVDEHQSMLISKFAQYAFYIILIMYILSCFGIKLSAVWGAAGIAGIAIGFAAQTSVSNLISGLFVLSEHIMKLGDCITVGDVTGIVDSIGLLSVKIHTFDNQLVRIPNSTIINTNLTNTSFFPTRRMTFSVSVSYDTDMNKALETLAKAGARCPTVLTDPAPSAWFETYGDSGISLTLAVWFKANDFLTTKNTVFIAIKQVFDEAGIDIPFNRLDVSFVGTDSGDAAKIEHAVRA